MDIISEIENKYKSFRDYGVQFSIEPDAYSKGVSDGISFGKNRTVIQGGKLSNYQDVILNGKTVGFLWERTDGGLFDPIMVSFCVFIADCQDDDFGEVYSQLKDHPNFYDEGEAILFRFATLKQLLDYVGKKSA